MKLFILFITFIFSALSVQADPPAARAQAYRIAAETCPLNMELNSEEKLALHLFTNRLQGMIAHYGKSSFQAALNGILDKHYPDQKVIEVSPVFYERILYIVDQQLLWNDIELTIGKNHPLWWRDYKPYMQTVTHFHYGLRDWEHDKLQVTLEKLTELISGLTIQTMKKKGLTQAEVDTIKKRTLLELEDVHMYIERWNIINHEIAQAHINDNLRTAGLVALGFLPGGVIVATTIRSGVIIGAATRFAMTVAGDVASASRLQKTSQILMGGVFGVAGGAAIQMDIDIYNIIAEASRNSKNNHSLYACEIDKQIRAWKSRGVAPYLKAAALGGSIGVGGGILTTNAVTAAALMHVTRWGVNGALLYKTYEFGEHTWASYSKLAEAQDVMARGGNAEQVLKNREEAKQILREARFDRQNAYEALLETLFIGLLAKEIHHEFPHAMNAGDDAIRILFASSADTMGTAYRSASAAVCAIAGSAICGQTQLMSHALPAH